MSWSKKTCLLAIFTLSILSVSLVSCTDKMADSIVDKFIDAMTGKKTTDHSAADTPFSIKINVNLGVFDANTKKAIYPCEINFSAEQNIGYRDVGTNSHITLYGEQLTANKQTDREGWARTTFLFKKMYKGDFIELAYQIGGRTGVAIIDNSSIKSAKQISKDSFELEYIKQIFMESYPR
jgi:hypothetical protein